MLCSQAFLVVVLTSIVAAAAPVEKRWFGLGWGFHGSSHPGPSWLAGPGMIAKGKRFPDASSNAPTCVLAAAVMPSGKSYHRP